MSISAAQIKAVRALSSKKGRDEAGCFIVEGEKLVSEALASDFEVVELWRREDIGESAMSRISQLSTPSPVLAVVRQRTALGRVIGGKQLRSPLPGAGLYLALDSIRDPGNLGTIIRIADWFGLDGVFMSPDTVDVFSPKVVQSTMGAIFRVPFAYCPLPSLAERAHQLGGHLYGTFLDGQDIYGTQLHTGGDAPSIIVIGNEAHGISGEIDALCDGRLRIPSFPEGVPTSESLNAAVATAIVVAEFRRREQE